MFPLLVWMYARLAKSEEVEALREFGSKYEHHAAVTSRWLPHWRVHDEAVAGAGRKSAR
jgi:protein-S-isoprenylcysteine O-methyltransferase Ste14